MSTPVLVAIILLAVGCAAALTRLRLADRRSVAAHHRALETMGRLVAQHPAGEAAATPEPPTGQAHVRLVDNADPTGPPVLPPLRARPRLRSRQPAEYRSWDDVVPVAAEFYPGEPVAPAAADLYPGEPAAPAAAGRYQEEPVPPAPVEPAPSRPRLHFDALAAPPPGPDAKKEKETVGAGLGPPPVSARRPRRRIRARRPRPRWGRNRRPAWRFLVVGVLVVLLAAAGTVGTLILRGDHGGASPPSHPPPRAASGPAPAPSPATTVAPPPAPVLVTTSAGYSEYRLAGPATIVLAASGTCWVQIRQDGRAGPVLFQGDLYAGQTRPAHGPIWLRLGNPTQVTITVNGAALSPPSLVAGEPYNLQFD
jgi:hypothetical protein